MLRRTLRTPRQRTVSARALRTQACRARPARVAQRRSSALRRVVCTTCRAPTARTRAGSLRRTPRRIARRPEAPVRDCATVSPVMPDPADSAGGAGVGWGDRRRPRGGCGGRCGRCRTGDRGGGGRRRVVCHLPERPRLHRARVCVDTRKAGEGAPRPPAHDAEQPSRVARPVGERSAAVALAGVGTRHPGGEHRVREVARAGGIGTRRGADDRDEHALESVGARAVPRREHAPAGDLDRGVPGGRRVRHRHRRGIRGGRQPQQGGVVLVRRRVVVGMDANLVHRNPVGRRQVRERERTGSDAQLVGIEAVGAVGGGEHPSGVDHGAAAEVDPDVVGVAEGQQWG